jgi:hypothetical protein
LVRTGPSDEKLSFPCFIRWHSGNAVLIQPRLHRRA